MYKFDLLHNGSTIAKNNKAVMPCGDRGQPYYKPKFWKKQKIFFGVVQKCGVFALNSA